ncbi:MAG: tetratricopeptide repeat protein [Bdellovibrionota bacterium]|jgi:tetratricopeptide (TPR) repeat protein
MSKKFLLWLISVSIVVSLAIVVVLSNSEPLTITIFPGKSISGNKGVLILAVFLSGIALACFIGSYFGIRSYIHKKLLEQRERKRETVLQALVKARGLSAVGDWTKARDLWQQIVKRNPDDMISQLELAKSFEGAGDLPNAIKTIEAARAKDSSNLEVLMYAAHLHALSGNKTVALDNIILALYHNKTEKVLRLARNLSEEIGRIDDALEQQDHLNQLGVSDADSKEAEARLRFKQLLNENRTKESAEEKCRSLRAFIKKYRYPAAYSALAEVLTTEKKFDEVAQILTDLAKNTKKAADWSSLVNFWLERQEAARALAAARSAVSNTDGDEKIKAELILIKTLLANGLFDDANSRLSTLQAELKESKTTLARDLQISVTLTRCLVAYKIGNSSELGNSLEDLIKLNTPTLARN